MLVLFASIFLLKCKIIFLLSLLRLIRVDWHKDCNTQVRERVRAGVSRAGIKVTFVDLCGKKFAGFGLGGWEYET
jgi:hypothetical protein